MCAKEITAGVPIDFQLECPLDPPKHKSIRHPGCESRSSRMGVLMRLESSAMALVVVREDSLVGFRFDVPLVYPDHLMH